MKFKKMLINFRKGKGYSGIIPFVYTGKEEMRKYIHVYNMKSL